MCQTSSTFGRRDPSPEAFWRNAFLEGNLSAGSGSREFVLGWVEFRFFLLQEIGVLNSTDVGLRSWRLDLTTIQWTKKKHSNNYVSDVFQRNLLNIPLSKGNLEQKHFVFQTKGVVVWSMFGPSLMSTMISCLFFFREKKHRSKKHQKLGEFWWVFPPGISCSDLCGMFGWGLENSWLRRIGPSKWFRLQWCGVLSRIIPGWSKWLITMVIVSSLCRVYSPSKWAFHGL